MEWIPDDEIFKKKYGKRTGLKVSKTAAYAVILEKAVENGGFIVLSVMKKVNSIPVVRKWKRGNFFAWTCKRVLYFAAL